jgi:hypothetical protein
MTVFNMDEQIASYRRILDMVLLTAAGNSFQSMGGQHSFTNRVRNKLPF